MIARFLTAALLFAIVPLFALAGTTGVLRGRVIDLQTGRPVADAQVTAASRSDAQETTTDANGVYVFISLAPDRYTVYAERMGHYPRSYAGIIVAADATTDARIALFNCDMCRISYPPLAAFMLRLNRDVTILNHESPPDGGIRSTAQALMFVPGIIP